MALGAQPAGLQRMFVRHGLTLAGIGAVAGLAAAAGINAADVDAVVWRFRSSNPVTDGAVALVLIGAAILAWSIPAWAGHQDRPGRPCGRSNCDNLITRKSFIFYSILGACAVSPQLWL